MPTSSTAVPPSLPLNVSRTYPLSSDEMECRGSSSAVVPYTPPSSPPQTPLSVSSTHYSHTENVPNLSTELLQMPKRELTPAAVLTSGVGTKASPIIVKEEVETAKEVTTAADVSKTADEDDAENILDLDIIPPPHIRIIVPTVRTEALRFTETLGHILFGREFMALYKPWLYGTAYVLWSLSSLLVAISFMLPLIVNTLSLSSDDNVLAGSLLPLVIAISAFVFALGAYAVIALTWNLQIIRRVLPQFDLWLVTLESLALLVVLLHFFYTSPVALTDPNEEATQETGIGAPRQIAAACFFLLSMFSLLGDAEVARETKRPLAIGLMLLIEVELLIVIAWQMIIVRNRQEAYALANPTSSSNSTGPTQSVVHFTLNSVQSSSSPTSAIVRLNVMAAGIALGRLFVLLIFGLRSLVKSIRYPEEFLMYRSRLSYAIRSTSLRTLMEDVFSPEVLSTLTDGHVNSLARATFSGSFPSLVSPEKGGLRKTRGRSIVTAVEAYRKSHPQSYAKLPVASNSVAPFPSGASPAVELSLNLAKASSLAITSPLPLPSPHSSSSHSSTSTTTSSSRNKSPHNIPSTSPTRRTSTEASFLSAASYGNAMGLDPPGRRGSARKGHIHIGSKKRNSKCQTPKVAHDPSSPPLLPHPMKSSGDTSLLELQSETPRCSIMVINEESTAQGGELQGGDPTSIQASGSPKSRAHETTQPVSIAARLTGPALPGVTQDLSAADAGSVDRHRSAERLRSARRLTASHLLHTSWLNPRMSLQLSPGSLTKAGRSFGNPLVGEQTPLHTLKASQGFGEFLDSNAPRASAEGKVLPRDRNARLGEREGTRRHQSSPIPALRQREPSSSQLQQQHQPALQRMITANTPVYTFDVNDTVLYRLLGGRGDPEEGEDGLGGGVNRAPESDLNSARELFALQVHEWSLHYHVYSLAVVLIWIGCVIMLVCAWMNGGIYNCDSASSSFASSSALPSSTEAGAELCKYLPLLETLSVIGSICACLGLFVIIQSSHWPAIQRLIYFFDVWYLSMNIGIFLFSVLMMSSGDAHQMRIQLLIAIFGIYPILFDAVNVSVRVKLAWALLSVSASALLLFCVYLFIQFGEMMIATSETAGAISGTPETSEARLFAFFHTTLEEADLAIFSIGGSDAATTMISLNLVDLAINRILVFIIYHLKYCMATIVYKDTFCVIKSNFTVARQRFQRVTHTLSMKSIAKTCSAKSAKSATAQSIGEKVEDEELAEEEKADGDNSNSDALNGNDTQPPKPEDKKD